MDKGIRPFALNKFKELNVQRQAGELTNTAFRKNVIASLMDNFGITLASAATHYNTAFKEVKKTNPETVTNLGRPEDKKGGRKPKVKAEAAAAGAQEANAGEAEQAAQEDTGEQAEGATIPDEAAGAALGMVDEQAAPPKTYTVKKKADGSVVAEGLLLEQAEELVAKAKAAKKAALEIA